MKSMNGSASHFKPFDDLYEDLTGFARKIDYRDNSEEKDLKDKSKVQPYRM
jgi:hypothetical protein